MKECRGDESEEPTFSKTGIYSFVTLNILYISALSKRPRYG